jgi:urease accessory protein
VPLAFISAMAIGGAFGITGVFLPSVELGIALSVVVFGVSVAAGLQLPTLAAMALAGFFALFHGQAHGAEMPETAYGLAYGLGFVLGTGLLHAAGIGLGIAIGTARAAFEKRVLQAAGSAMALAGVAILAGSL